MVISLYIWPLQLVIQQPVYSDHTMTYPLTLFYLADDNQMSYKL